ncbi:MAG: EAL domain-containing protein [Stappiaceae bacterium]
MIHNALKTIWPIAVLAVAAFWSGLLTPLENRLAEMRMSLIERPPTGEIVLVDIDSKSLRDIGQWPWPRDVHASLIDQLMAVNVREIAFDIDFSSRSSPASDAALEAALERAGGSVILATFNQTLTTRSGGAAMVSNQPIDRFARHAWPAVVNVLVERDGIVRRFPYGDAVAGEELPSLPAMLGGYSGDASGYFFVDFGIKAGDILRLSAIDVINEQVSPNLLRDKKVIIGAGAVELRDTFAVPKYGTMSGPLLQALSAESIQQGRNLVQISSKVIILACLIVLALLGLAIATLPWRMAIGLVAVTMLGIEGGAILLQTGYPVLPQTGIFHVAGLLLIIAVVLQEISFRKMLLFVSRKETKNTQLLLDQVITDNFDGVVVIDRQGIIHSVSDATSRILQEKTATIKAGQSVSQALPKPLVSIFAEAKLLFDGDSSQSSFSGEIDIETSEMQKGRILEYVLTASQIEQVSADGSEKDPDCVFCLTFRDVTEERKAQRRITYLARFDTLTGLPNRNQFLDTLERLINCTGATQGPLALLSIDLDRFKTINDTLGHQVGDRLLCAFADRFRDLVEDPGLLARLGGDEFCLLIPDAPDPQVLSSNLQKMIDALCEPYDIGDHRMLIGVSFGVAFAPQPDVAPDQLMKDSDTALYRAKSQNGSAFCFFDPEMDVALQRRRSLEADLRGAIERSEFHLLYQPQTDLETGALIGVEALIRWDHPERGLVPPDDFISIAEETGLIVPIGAWVLQKACQDAVLWPESIKIAVNLSAVQFTSGTLLDTVKEALTTSGLPAHLLDLEITESLFINENSTIRNQLQMLRDLGIQLSLDDFGTGYSSLGYLSKYPIDKIKIDRAFVKDLPQDPAALAIIQSVAILAGSLDLTLLAEGIETLEQASLLKLAGCTQAQGYFYGKPQSSDNIIQLMRNWKAIAA